MEHSVKSPQIPAQREQSTGDLVKQLSDQVSLLVRAELKMARLEMTSKGKQAGVGVGMFSASGLGVLYAIACLLAAAIIAISGEIRPWLAALIVGLALLAASAVAALVGKGRMKRATPPVPEQTVDSAKADVEEVRERMHR
jgi:Putative Actinobacterial Holin-X, holin superfamily III